MSLYQLLGVAKTATIDQIKKAFRKIAVLLHPDKGGDTEKFQQIVRAKEILTEESLKRIYDKYGDGRKLRKAITKINRFGSAPSNKQSQTAQPETESNPVTIIVITKDGSKEIEPNDKCGCGKGFEQSTHITQCAGCKKYYHLTCAKLTQNDARNHHFKCDNCHPDEVYEVEKILDRKEATSDDIPTVFYLVKWRGYEYQDWIRRDDLTGCAKLVNNWLRRRGLEPEMEENSRLGSSGVNIVPENWITIEDFYKEVGRIRSYLKNADRIKLPIIEFTDDSKLEDYDAVYIYNYENHAYVFRYISSSDVILLADGANSYIENEDIQRHFKVLLNKEIKALIFGQQPSDNKCGSSAVYIAIEMMKPTITRMNTIRVNKKHFLDSNKRLHQVPQKNMRCFVEKLHKFKCNTCKRQFGNKKKMIAHQLKGRCSEQQEA